MKWKRFSKTSNLFRHFEPRKMTPYGRNSNAISWSRENTQLQKICFACSRRGGRTKTFAGKRHKDEKACFLSFRFNVQKCISFEEHLIIVESSLLVFSRRHHCFQLRGFIVVNCSIALDILRACGNFLHDCNFLCRLFASRRRRFQILLITCLINDVSAKCVHFDEEEVEYSVRCSEKFSWNLR